LGPVFGALEAGFVGFVEGIALLLTLLKTLLFGSVFDVVGGGSAIGSNDGCG
jgi:hypothetical protein